jgi:hypothetical protein
LAFYVVRVRYAAIDWANGCTLWFFVKTYTLGTFVGDNVIIIVGNRHLLCLGVYAFSAFKFVVTTYSAAIANCPLHTTLIDGIVGAFGFARAAVNTFISYNYGHIVNKISSYFRMIIL